MKNLSYKEFLDKLKQRFPSLEILDGSKFNNELKENTSFWLRNSESVTYTDKDKNTLYKANDYFNKNYEFEVYKKFNKWCNRYGWYASTESYTMQIFKL